MKHELRTVFFLFQELECENRPGIIMADLSHSKHVQWKRCTGRRWQLLPLVSGRGVSHADAIQEALF